MRKTLEDALDGITIQGVSLSEREKSYFGDMFSSLVTAINQGTQMNQKELKNLRSMIASINTNKEEQNEFFNFIESFATGKLGNRGGNI